MKRFLGLACLVVFAVTRGSAQSSGGKDDSYHGGFTAFVGLTSFTADFTPALGSNITTGNASGFAAGIGMITHLGGPIGLELDGAYVQAGLTETGSVGGITGTETVHDNNVGGSLVLRPAFGSGPVRVFLVGGGSVAYLINCTSSFSPATTSSSCKVAASQNRTDYSAVIGGGVSFGVLAVQLRYDIGLANLTKTTGETVKSKGLLVIGSLIL